MPVGDIRLDTLTVGSIDVGNSLDVQLVGFNVYEDLFNPYGVTAEIKINDYLDALGRTNLTGKEDVKIEFSLYDLPSDTLSFDLKCFENKDLTDRSNTGKTSLKHKQYVIRCITEEYLTAQAKGALQQDFNAPIHDSIRKLVKEVGFMSKKPFMTDDPTKGKIRHVGSGHPIEIYQQLNDRAVSMKNKSSAYVLHVSGEKYKYCTIEELCRKGPVASLSQSTTLGAGSTEQQKLNSITDILVSTSFFTANRSRSLTKQSTYDPVTGKATYPLTAAFSKFVHLGNPVFKEKPSGNVQKTHTQHDRANNKTSTDIAEARQNRAAYLSYLAQNNAEMTIPGNPNIKLGSVINITIPNKSTDNAGEERQFTGPVLVTNIRHIIHPLTTQPRYQMRLKVTKAGGYAQGGE